VRKSGRRIDSKSIELANGFDENVPYGRRMGRAMPNEEYQGEYQGQENGYM
jgi:hypothetical protein